MVPAACTCTYVGGAIEGPVGGLLVMTGCLCWLYGAHSSHAENFAYFLSIQRIKGQRYRFSLLVQELKGAETEEYVASILAFINCLIAGASDLTSRVTLRNEVIGEQTDALGSWRNELTIAAEQPAITP